MFKSRTMSLSIFIATPHKAGLRSDTVGDGLHPSVRQKDRVLAGDLESQCSGEIKSEYHLWVTLFLVLDLAKRKDLFSITLLLLVEVVAFVILHGVSIPGLMFYLTNV